MKYFLYIATVINLIFLTNCTTTKNINPISYNNLKINPFKPDSEQSILTLEIQNYKLKENEEEVYFLGFQVTYDTYYFNNYGEDNLKLSEYSGITLSAINKMLEKWDLDSIHIIKVTESTESFLFPLYWKNISTVEGYPLKLKSNSSIKLIKKNSI